MSEKLPRVFLAIGMKPMEEFLKKQLIKEFKFVGEAIYREAVVKNALACNPDIVVLRETLNGSEDILDIVYELRLQLPDSRVVFLASDRKPGDSLLAELVGNGVYDIMTGNRLSAPDLMTLMREPNKFSDVAMYRRKMNMSQTKEHVSEAPPVKEVVKQVKETVFVEGDAPILPPNFGEKTEEPKERRKSEPKKTKRNRRRFLKKKEEEPKNNETKVDQQEDEPLISFDPTLPKEEPQKPSEPTLPAFEPPQIEPPIIDVPGVEPPNKPASEPETEVKFDFNPMNESKEEQPEDNPEPTPEPIKPVEKTTPLPTPVQPTAPAAFAGNGKQKILTFVGGEHGVGNSQVAFNTALSLAKKGFKTIFIELKEQGSTIEYLYQLALVDKGLDYALRHLESENLLGLDQSIIRMNEVRDQNRNSLMKPIYQQFTESLDFLFFSPDYILETDPSKKAFDPVALKELCMHLLFQSGYHYIVLDAEPDLHNQLTEVALGFGTHVFFTLTQDVTHIGRAVRNISEINKRINIVDKLYYIVNKFDKEADLSRRDIEGWLKADIKTLIPLEHKEFVNANMQGQPLYLFSKNKALKQSFDEVVAHILKQ